MHGFDWLMLRSYHAGHKNLHPIMLFNLTHDPHEQNDLAKDRPVVVNQAMQLLDDWMGGMMRRSPTDVDPLMTVLREGGPFHTRGMLPSYLKHLKETGRSHHAETLIASYPDEVGEGNE